jgi:predicted ATPase
MIVEDAHWIDPTSLEVFGRTVDQIKGLRGIEWANLGSEGVRKLCIS